MQVRFKEKTLCDLVEISNRFFRSLTLDGHISENKMKCFMYQNKKITNLGKLYLLPKIHERLYHVPGRLVISNCGTPTEKVSEFLDHHLKPIMQEDWSYIKDTEDLFKKFQNMGKIP